jgi:hypothetical protein
MTNLNNNTGNVIALGLEAARRWKLAGEHGEAGDATAIVALYEAARTMTFTATVERKKDDIVETFDFEIADMLNPYYNNDGSKDTRKMAARTALLAERLFGITELTNAIKQRLGRTIMSAVYLANTFNKLDDEEYMARVALKGGKLTVPYGVVAAPPAADASDNDKQFFAAMADKMVALDGKKGLSLAELGKRANPPKTGKRAAGANKDQGASLVSSIDFVTAIVLQQTNESSDESDVALTTENRRKLFNLASAIAAYFAADPLEDEEVEPIAANG